MAKKQQTTMAKFSEVIECLKNGGTAQRIAWDVEGDKEIMMQIPQRIAKDIVPKMTSVQNGIKPKLSTVGSGEIEYHDQVIIISFTDDGKTPARATYYIPTWEDIFADFNPRVVGIRDKPYQNTVARMKRERNSRHKATTVEMHPKVSAN